MSEVLHVNVSGAALALALAETTSTASDCSGLLFGEAHEFHTQAITDTNVAANSVRRVVIRQFICFPRLDMMPLVGRSGRLDLNDMQKLISCYKKRTINNQLTFLGFFHFRRGCSFHTITAGDVKLLRALTRDYKHFVADDVVTPPILVLICLQRVKLLLSTRYVAYHSRENWSGEMEERVCPINVTNLGDTSHADYRIAPLTSSSGSNWKDSTMMAASKAGQEAVKAVRRMTAEMQTQLASECKALAHNEIDYSTSCNERLVGNKDEHRFPLNLDLSGMGIYGGEEVQRRLSDVSCMDVDTVVESPSHLSDMNELPPSMGGTGTTSIYDDSSALSSASRSRLYIAASDETPTRAETQLHVSCTETVDVDRSRNDADTAAETLHDDVGNCQLSERNPSNSTVSGIVEDGDQMREDSENMAQPSGKRDRGGADARFEDDAMQTDTPPVKRGKDKDKDHSTDTISYPQNGVAVGTSERTSSIGPNTGHGDTHIGETEAKYANKTFANRGRGRGHQNTNH